MISVGWCAFNVEEVMVFKSVRFRWRHSAWHFVHRHIRLQKTFGPQGCDARGFGGTQLVGHMFKARCVGHTAGTARLTGWLRFWSHFTNFGHRWHRLRWLRLRWHLWQHPWEWFRHIHGQGIFWAWGRWSIIKVRHLRAQPGMRRVWWGHVGGRNVAHGTTSQRCGTGFFTQKLGQCSGHRGHCRHCRHRSLRHRICRRRWGQGRRRRGGAGGCQAALHLRVAGGVGSQHQVDQQRGRTFDVHLGKHTKLCKLWMKEAESGFTSLHIAQPVLLFGISWAPKLPWRTGTPLPLRETDRQRFERPEWHQAPKSPPCSRALGLSFWWSIASHRTSVPFFDKNPICKEKGCWSSRMRKGSSPGRNTFNGFCRENVGKRFDNVW